MKAEFFTYWLQGSSQLVKNRHARGAAQELLVNFVEALHANHGNVRGFGVDAYTKGTLQLRAGGIDRLNSDSQRTKTETQLRSYQNYVCGKNCS